MKPVIQIPESVHAILSPSKAHMWLACAAALGAGKDLPRRPPSRYAAEGTVYHDVCRRALTEDKDCSAYIGDRYLVDGFDFTVDADNCEAAQQYVDAVRAIPGVRRIEVDLEYSALLQVPREALIQREPEGAGVVHSLPVAAGTGDCVIVDDDNKIIWVIDLKFGRGDIVYAAKNPQLRLYGAAAVARYEMLGIEDNWKVSMAIHQPRAPGGHYDSEVITVAELKAWVAEQSAKANEAYTLWLSPHLINASRFTPGEKQCRWCPLSGNCVAQNSKVLDQFPKSHAAEAIPALHTLDTVQLAEALDRADELENYVSALRANALARALNGEVLPNWKVVEGRRGNRQLDTEARVLLSVEAQQEIGIEEPEQENAIPVSDALHFAAGDAAYKPRDFKTTAQLQKVLEKKAPLLWAALQAHVTQSEGKPSLERMEDPRAPLPVMTHEFPLAESTESRSLL